MRHLVSTIYNKTVLGFPKVTIIISLAIVGFFGLQVGQFQFDASSETLLLENDKDLDFYRKVKSTYGSDEYLIITYTPKKEMYHPLVLNDIKKLKNNLEQIKSVEHVTTILNIPLIKSPPVSLSQLSQKLRTIENGNININMARNEILTSPMYSSQIMSKDGKTTTLIVQFKEDIKFKSLLKIRDELKARKQKLKSKFSIKENLALVKASNQFTKYRYIARDNMQREIQKVREIMKDHQKNADLFLGGVPMITSDSLDYIKNDVKNFGVLVTLFLIITMMIIFGTLRWVVLPVVTCALATIFMMGFLGWIGWPVTVVSSNFISLLLIICLSLIVHLIVNYREMVLSDGKHTSKQLVKNMINNKYIPCFYTAATTIVAFGSLLISGILPIKDFGLMMSMGIITSFLLAFTFFPSVLILLKPEKKKSAHNKLSQKITKGIADFIHRHSKLVLYFFIFLFALSIVGINKLTVENRFIDYYKKSTPIYQGMVEIDSKLGGTTPLDIIIDAPEYRQNINSKRFYQTHKDVPRQYGYIDNIYVNEGDELYDADLNEEYRIADSSYWFNSQKIPVIHEIHKYLESIPEIGKVMSLSTTFQMLEEIDSSATANNTYLSMLYAAINDNLKSKLFSPYMTKNGNQLRFSTRVFESDYSLKRDQLINKINNDLKNKFNLEPSQVKLSGMLVLYNNMLQSFFKSQILTIGVVFVLIFFMLIFSFNNIRMALIGLLPNISASAFVLGVMGWFKIPLDLMTITIAAICIGIGVDNTIHYVHRFNEEFKRDHNYWQSVKRSHGSIGIAMYYTTLIITIGFSILVFSNFVPTIYFGLLTGLSMLVALLANIALLPILIVLFKPVKVKSKKL